MKNIIEILYKDLQDRLKYLEAQKQTEEVKWRIQEITLAIVRVQQLLLPEQSAVSGSCDCEENACCYYCEVEKTGVRTLTAPGG